VSKKTIFLFAIVMTVGMSAFAQNEREAESTANKFSIGIGPELNMNSPEGFAGGAGLSFDYSLANALALGITAAFSHNFAETMALEVGALFRYYLLGIGHTGFFAQADIGTTIIMDDNDETPPAVFMGGLRTGHRINIGSGFVEPYFRIGYPFAFGVGVIGGIRFNIAPGNRERPARNSGIETSAASEE